MTPDHPAYEKMHLAVTALCTRPEHIRGRLLAAAGYIDLKPSDLRSDAEWNLYHRICSSFVAGGEEQDEEADGKAVEESLNALNDDSVREIACDILHMFELVAAIDPADATWRWP
jgi:hypothetical protein